VPAGVPVAVSGPPTFLLALLWIVAATLSGAVPSPGPRTNLLARRAATCETRVATWTIGHRDSLSSAAKKQLQGIIIN
jgi:hypothetical protein